MTMYLTKTLWEKNASHGLELHPDLEAAADAIGENAAAGAISIQLFEVAELDYETVTKTSLLVKRKGETDA